MSYRTLQAIQHYGIAVLAVAFATGVRLLLDRYLAERVPFVTYFVAVAFAARYGGLWPSVAATVLSALAAAMLFIPPQGLAITGAAGWVGLAAFLFVGVAIAYLGEKMRSAQKQAEKRHDQLQESESRKRAIFDTALDAIITIDCEGRIVEFNPAAEQILGFSRSEVEGKEMAALILPPAMRQEYRRGVQHYLQTGEGPVLNRRLELTALHADGHELPVELAITPIDSEGELLFTGHLRDITERNLQRAALNERMRLAAAGRDVGLAMTQGEDLRGMLQRSAKAIVAHLDGAVVHIWTLNESEGALELQAAAGSKAETLRQKRVLLDDNPLGSIAQTHAPSRENSIAGESKVPYQEWAVQQGLTAFAGFPLLMENRLAGVMTVFNRDIFSEVAFEELASVATGIALGIERRQSEKRVQEQRERLRTTLASIGDAVITTDTAFRVTNFNSVAEELTGWKAEEAIGRPLDEVFRIVNENTRQTVKNPAARSLEEGVIVGLANHTIRSPRTAMSGPSTIVLRRFGAQREKLSVASWYFGTFPNEGAPSARSARVKSKHAATWPSFKRSMFRRPLGWRSSTASCDMSISMKPSPRSMGSRPSKSWVVRSARRCRMRSPTRLNRSTGR